MRQHLPTERLSNTYSKSFQKLRIYSLNPKQRYENKTFVSTPFMSKNAKQDIKYYESNYIYDVFLCFPAISFQY